MNFEDRWVDRARRFALGIETVSGRCYLSIPVSNALVDYDEYYAIDQPTFDRFRRGEGVDGFLATCRARQNDAQLMLPPGRDRGVPA